MPTPFSHIWAAIALSPFFSKKRGVLQLLLLGMFCTIVPDADVIAFDFGIPYGHLFGHRGFTHSIFFSVLLSVIILMLFYRKQFAITKQWLPLFIYFFLCTFSHTFFDAMTNGGKGVAMFAPFYNERIFLPWRPIQVAPLSWDGLMSDWGRRVLISEFKVIWIPCILFLLVVLGLKKIDSK